MKVMNASAFRHYFHSPESARTTIREALAPVLHVDRLQVWMKALAEAYVDDSIEQAGTWYAAALDEIRLHRLVQLHEQMASSDISRTVLKHCVSQEQMAPHLGIAGDLIDAGIPVDLKLDSSEFTALHWAASKSKPQMVNALLDRGADLEACGGGSERVTPLIRAIELNDVAMVKGLLARGADVEATTGSGMDALMTAISRGWTQEMLEAIVAAGADVQAHRKNGDCPMTLAAQMNHAAAVSYLVSAGADPSAKIADGKASALLIALHNGNGGAVRALLQHGADPVDLHRVTLEYYLTPSDVEFVRSFSTEYEITHAINIPTEENVVHNGHNADNFPRKTSASSFSPL